jgi:hypothetical protein
LIRLNRTEVAGLKGAGYRVRLLETLHNPLEIQGRQLTVTAPLQDSAWNSRGNGNMKGTTRAA